MSTSSPVTFEMPTDEEIVQQLSVTNPMEQRVRWVKQLVRASQPERNAIENLQKEVDRLERKCEGQAQELRTLHEKYGDLSPSEKAAAQRAYERLGQVKKVSGYIDVLERDMIASIRQMREAVKKPT